MDSESAAIRKEMMGDFLLAQKKIKNPTKNSINPHFKNRYANLETVIDCIKDALLEFNFVITQECRGHSVTSGVIVVVTTLRHSSGGVIEFECAVPVEKMTPQAGMSAFTYGRRYGLLSALCLAAEDDDGNEATLTDGKQHDVKPIVSGITKAQATIPKGLK